MVGCEAMGTGRDIEAFADLRAAMEAGESRDRVLERAGMTSTQWVALQRRWLRALALEADRGGSSLLKRYERRMASSEPEVPAPVVVPEAAPAPRPPPPAPVQLPSEPVAPTAPSGPSPWAPVPAPPATTPDATQFVQAVEVKPATPFGGGAGGSRPAPAAEAVAAEGAVMAGGTAFVAPVTDEELGLNTPLQGSVDETAAISGLKLGDLAAAMPFDGSASVDAPAVAHDVQNEQAALAGGTAFVGALTDADLATAHPSETLSLEQYASLVADLAVRADARGATLARYGLDEAAFVSTKASFNRRFAQDPALHGAFRRAYDAYSQWLGRSGESGG